MGCIFDDKIIENYLKISSDAKYFSSLVQDILIED